MSPSRRSTVFWVSRFPPLDPISFRSGLALRSPGHYHFLRPSFFFVLEGFMAMVMQSQSSEWPMKFCVYVCVCTEDERLVPVCKRERENKKRNKSCFVLFLPIFEFAFGKWCGAVRGGAGAVEWSRCHSSCYDLILINFFLLGLSRTSIIIHHGRIVRS